MTIVIALRSRDSLVGLVRRRTSAIPGGGKKCSLLRSVQSRRRLWDALSGGKMARTEDDHSPLCSAEVKMGGAIPPSSECLHGLHSHSFTFSFFKSLGLVLSYVTGLP